jgi:hypothetical protein
MYRIATANILLCTSIPGRRAPAGSASQRFERSRKLVHHKLVDLHLVVDGDSDQIAVGVVVENNTFGNLRAFDAGLLREINVKRISLRIIVEFHGLNRRSRKALWIVTLSSRVVTLR